MTDQLHTLRGVWALEGINWRAWSAADRASAVFHLLKRSLTGADLRELYTLVGDTAAIAAFDRDAMGQTGGVQLTDMGVARG